MSTVLIIGYGNPGRLDDGLGPALAEIFERKQLDGVTVEADYQLTVEDAALVANFAVVVFADAAVTGDGPFWLKQIFPAGEVGGFTTHGVAPHSVLALAKQLFHAEPRAFLLGIRGYEFNEFGEGLSDVAAANLGAAARYLEQAIRQGEFSEVRREVADAVAPDPR